MIHLDCFPMSISLVYAAKREEKHGRDGHKIKYRDEAVRKIGERHRIQRKR